MPAPPGRGAAAGADPAPGLGAVGIGGLPGGLGTPGFEARGGADGLGLAATGGGGLPARELDGLELAGLSSDAVDDTFFHGVADPLEGAMPGKTDTGLAEESAATDLMDCLADEIGVGFTEGEADVAEGGGRRFGGGGGGGGAFAWGGTSSR